MSALLSHPLEFWLFAGLAVLLIGVAKAGFGSGIGVAATPLLALVLPVVEAAALLLPLLLVADVFAVRHYRGTFDRSNLWLLLPSAAVGIVLGGLFFERFIEQERVLKVGIGLINRGRAAAPSGEASLRWRRRERRFRPRQRRIRHQRCRD